jgi:hypothetical protein
MLDGHGSEMSRRARETRNRKKDSTSIFNKKKIPSAYQSKIELEELSSHQKKQLARKVKQLTEDEQIRIMMIFGLSFVIFLIILLISIM